MKKSICFVMLLCFCFGISILSGCDLFHNHSPQLYASNEATCEEDGNTEYYLCNCGKYFLLENEKFIEISKESITIPATGHNYGSWSTIISPTCGEEGLDKRTCLSCGDEQSQSIPKLTTHTYGGWYTTSLPTCTKTGEEKRICSVCSNSETRTLQKLEHRLSDWKFNTNSHWKACSSCNQHFSTASHNFGQSSTNQGITISTCETCGYIKETLPTSLTAYGSGTTSDPFLIYTAEQYYEMFNAFGTSDGKGTGLNAEEKLNVKLMRDIELNGNKISLSNSTAIFKCTFDGNNKSITTNKLNCFPNISGQLKNLKIIVSGSLSGTTASSNYLTRQVDSTGKISNCSLEGLDKYTCAYTGFASMNYGTIENCENRLNANISDNNSRAGIAGHNYESGMITNCKNYANINCNYSSNGNFQMAGIAISNEGKISGCQNFGTITYGNTRSTVAFAGLVVYVGNGSVITNCANYGEIIADHCPQTGILFGAILVATNASEAERQNITLENCIYLKNNSINSSFDWLGRRDSYDNETITTNFPNFELPTAVAKIPA